MNLTPEGIAPLLEKFHARYTPGTPDECWDWAGPKSQGYGRLNHQADNKPQRFLAHRIAWVAHHGRPLSDFLVVDHLCGVKSCVNPAHLENVRRYHLARTGPPPTPDEVKIRQRAAAQAHLAKRNARRREWLDQEVTCDDCGETFAQAYAPCHRWWHTLFR